MLSAVSELPQLEGKVVVAMSGGVDSSVAALLLRKAGHEVVGVSMQVWDYRNNGGCSTRATCCAPDDFNDARRVAATVGVPYYVLDFEHYFRAEVIDRFVNSYREGITPNPCVDCNQRVKFKELRARALQFGCQAVATGHYAQIISDNEGYHLLRGEDSEKDQSYFLYGLTQQELRDTLFPVGGLTKTQVRAIARDAGLVTAEKKESQDICFVSGTVGEFMARRGIEPRSGEIVTRIGRVVGRHDGIHHFTVGQRRGLNVGGEEEPLYVIELDRAENRVIVGNRADLERGDFAVDECNWVAPLLAREGVPAEGLTAIAQLRHRHPGVKVNITPSGERSVRVEFESQWTTVTPGQAAVFYDSENREVLGGGRIRHER